MRIVLNTICVEPNRWTPHRTPYVPLLDLLEPIANAGFSLIDIWSPHVEKLAKSELHQVSQRCKDLGLEVTRLSTYLTGALSAPGAKPVEQAASHLCDLAGVLGASDMRIFFGNKGFKQFNEDLWSTTMHQAEVLLEQAQKAGITIAAETHDNTACDCLEGCLEVLRRLQGKIGLIYQYMSKDVCMSKVHLRTLSTHIHAIHLQDRDDKEQFTRLGAGTIGYGEILATAKECGIDGDLVIEFVEGCKVSDPATFDLSKILQTAVADRKYVEAIWQSA
jgi:sugar phosphate isomerase/epimerase